MKKVTCPNCSNYGSPPSMEESMLVFDLEEEGASTSELEPNVSAVEMLAAEEAAEEGGVEESFEQEAAEAEALADDFVLASDSTQDRINKLAKLMAGEFSNGNLGSFSR